MHFTHAAVLAQARSYIAALASSSSSADAAIEYESALIELDAMHQGDTPPNAGVTLPIGEVYDAAFAVIEDLATHGVDRLSVELVLVTLSGARDLEQPRPS